MIFVECPHCGQKIEVVKLNCRIFRCGIYKKDYKQINPHMPKDECDSLKSRDLIYGCSRPFMVVDVSGGEGGGDGDESLKAVVCEYI